MSSTESPIIDKNKATGRVSFSPPSPVLQQSLQQEANKSNESNDDAAIEERAVNDDEEAIIESDDNNDEDAAIIDAVTGEGIGNHRGRGSVRSANSSAIASTPSKKLKTTALTADSPLPLSDVSNKNEGRDSDAVSPTAAAAAATATTAAAAEEGENQMECIATTTTTTTSSSNINNEDSNADDDYHSTNVLGDDVKIVPEHDDDAAEIQTPASCATEKELRHADFAMLYAMSNFTKTQVRLEPAPRDTLFEVPPLSAEEEQWYKDLPDKLRKRWKELSPDEQKKLKGRRSPKPPQQFIVTTTMEDGSGEICVATATSLSGSGEYRRYIPGKGGEKVQFQGRRGDGTLDPKSLLGQIGGRRETFYGLETNKSIDYRGLKITRVLGEDSKRFIEATEEAEKNKEVFKKLMEEMEEDRKKENGYPTGKTAPMYHVVPAEGFHNVDKNLPDVCAKVKCFECLKHAIGQNWIEEKSGMISRLKGIRKLSDRKYRQAEVAHDMLLNGYTVKLIESEADFDKLAVSITYAGAQKDRKSWPKPLPKREL